MILTLPEVDESEVRLDTHVDGARAWHRESMTTSDWTVPFPADALAELDAVVRRLRHDPLPLLLRHPTDFELSASADVIRKVRKKLVSGIGLTVVDRLPMDRWTEDEAIGVYWLLGQLLARPVATKWDGTMTYHVRDTGKQFGGKVRGSATNSELWFHTDNAFGQVLPEYVGLLCINPAPEGGISRFASLYTVHNRLRAEHPRLLERLYQPAYFDRQGEFRPGAPPVIEALPLRYAGGKLHARLVPGLVRRGYALVGEDVDPALEDALETVQEIFQDESLWVEFRIERGQLQYLNNLECAHFRSAFTDGGPDDPKRHMVRVWHRESGKQTYDGV